MRPKILAALLMLSSAAQALTSAPALPLSNLSGHRVNTFPLAEAQLHQEFPEYIGFEIWHGELYLAVGTTDPVRRQKILERVSQLHADVLNFWQFHAGKVTFLLPPASPFNPSEIAQTLSGIRGLIFTQHSSEIGRTIIGLQDESQRPAAQKVLREAGVAEDSYLIISGPQRGLQSRDLKPRLAGEYTTRFDMPSSIEPGKTVHSSIIFRNTGRQTVTLDFGTCLPPTEIREAQTGKLVLGIPWMTFCAGVGQMVTLAPGEETLLKEWTWAAQFPDGSPLPPGRYVMRAAAAGISLQIDGKYGPSGVVVPPAKGFTVK